MAKNTTTQSREELTKELAAKQSSLMSLTLSVGGFKSSEKKSIRKDIARIQTSISSLDKSNNTL